VLAGGQPVVELTEGVVEQVAQSLESTDDADVGVFEA
jgi:hypothetical protein